MKKHLIAAAVLAAALALLAGCGSDDDPEQASTTDDSAAPAEAEADDPVDDTGDDTADASGALVSTAETDAGEVLVDEAGLSLYGFTEDTDGTPTCEDACADAWPPLIVEGDALPEGLDAEVYSVVERADGTFQLVAGEWPLYRFAGDAAPGDVNGQGSGGVWFLAAPGGTLITDDSADAAGSADEETTTTVAGGYGY